MIQRRKPLKRASLKKKQKVVTTIGDMMSSGNVFKASEAPKPRKRIRVRAKNNPGWVDVARAIWDGIGNDHCCEVCGKWLGNDFSPGFYHHLLHRGHYKKMIRRPENLAQVCFNGETGCHDKAHKFGIEKLATTPGVLWQPMWALLNHRLVTLRDEANGIS